VAFAGINHWAVMLAAILGWLVGAGWYRALARPWMIALGKTRSELLAPSGQTSLAPFAVAFVAQLAMASVLAGFVGHLGPVTIATGVIAGLFAWLGFVITTLAVSHGFARHRAMLTVIDGGHWLAVLLIQGAVIGLFGS
jgi:hypothetical protein